MTATTVPAWVWHTTTLAAATVTLSLIAVLTAHVVISVLDDGPQTPGADQTTQATRARAELRSRLARIAALLVAVFLLVVLVRLGILLAERPSR